MFAVSGHVQEARRVRGRVRRHHLPRPASTRPIYGGGIRDGQRAQGVHPRRRVGAVVLRGAPRPAARGGRGRQGRLDARLGRHRRHGRDHRRGEGVPAGRALLRPRVVRQVHAVPRGHDAGWRRSSSASSTATAGPSDLDLLLDVCDNISPRHHLAAAADHDLPARPVGGRRRSRRRSCASATSSRPRSAGPAPITVADQRRRLHPQPAERRRPA